MDEKIDISQLMENMNSGGFRMKQESYKKKPNKYQNNSKQGRNLSRSGNGESTYVGAPYNFIGFYNDVVEVEKERMPVHNLIREDLLTGEISYRLTAQTPVFVDDGSKQHNFVKNEYDKYVIPGSSMRGLIRSNVQILGLSGFDEDIDSYNLMYRKVAGKGETSKTVRKRYEDILGLNQKTGVLTHVKAGYIAKKGNSYVIYRTKVDRINKELDEMNYYILSERTIVHDATKNGGNAYPYFKKHPEVMMNRRDCQFKKTEDRNRRTHYVGELNKRYNPGYYDISYEVKDMKNVSAVDEKGRYSLEGTLLGTGKMNEKKALYIIPEIDESKEVIEIPDNDVSAFKIDFEKRKNILKNFGDLDFFNLPKEGEKKPVFYIKAGEHLYFGFTPRLRIFYEHSIKEGYHQKVKDFDYAKSIFGCIGDRGSYKSKVSFSDAVVCGNAEKCEKRNVILSEPKPSSYLDYLSQKNGGNTYNAQEFELRGVKQYWLHKELPQYQFGTENECVDSAINALAQGTVFGGKIRFQNLTQDELGLLVWSLKLNKDSWMNIGKAKSYGYGAISVSDVEVRTINYADAYSLEGALQLEPFADVDSDELIQVYKKTVNAKIPSHDIDNLPMIKDFFRMKDSTCIPVNAKTKYMDIKTYQSRQEPLPSVEEVISGKK